MPNPLRPHDHACLVYSEPDQLRRTLLDFVEDARRENEVVVFIHAFDADQDAIRFLEESGQKVQYLLKDWFFLLSPHQAAFERNGKIDYPHVAATVTAILSNAKQRGRSGLRIFVDASRKYLSTGRAAEWFRFEEWLGRRLLHEVVLVCAYQSEHATQADWGDRILRTHLYRFEKNFVADPAG